MSLALIRKQLKVHANPMTALTQKKFFKNCSQDIFLGIPTPILRKLAKDFVALSFVELKTLMASEVHEERSLASFILCIQYIKATETQQTKIFKFYLKNRHTIRDWDGVDNSAPYIVGRHLLTRNTDVLYKLARSKNLWDRRIAIVSTWWFIRHGKISDTLDIAKILLDDQEDLIHKATGWMLREVGKQDLSALKHFLRTHYTALPRTTLRYAIERFAEKERKRYLKEPG
jgi:3-methyladenine DNA glycosylase AlkD